MLSRLTLGLLVALPLTFGPNSLQCGGGGDDDTPPPPTPIISPTPGACMVTGCSGQVCAAQDTPTTCEWKCEYGCYQYAECELQAAGACGWTETPAFQDCLKKCSVQP